MELLVVIGIAGLLVGLLVPAMAGLRGSAEAAACLTHLRQMAFAADAYALDHQYYPPALRYEPGAAGLTTIAWDYTQTADGQISPGALWAYTDTPHKVHQCPTYHGPSNFGADPSSGYNYNTDYIGGEGQFPFTGWNGFRNGVRKSGARHCGRCVIFGDGGYAAGANKFMRGPENIHSRSWGEVYSGGQAYRHVGGSTNVAFLDGSVESRRDPRCGLHATDLLLEQTLGYPDNGFLTEDDFAYDPR